MTPAILYLHGFRSSPASWKSQLLGEALAARGLADRLHCPQLSHRPKEAIAQASAIIRANDGELTLVGSSLGGFYATWLAESFGLRAVLINPAVVAPMALGQYVGPQTHLHTGEMFEFTNEHIAELQSLEVTHITPSRYFVLLETGDEVLDYRHAVSRYAGSRQAVFDGGDHSFTRFREMLPQLFEFCRL